MPDANFPFSIFNSKTAKRLIQEKPPSPKARRNKNSVGHERFIIIKTHLPDRNYSLFVIHYSLFFASPSHLRNPLMICSSA